MTGPDRLRFYRLIGHPALNEHHGGRHSNCEHGEDYPETQPAIGDRVEHKSHERYAAKGADLTVRAERAEPMLASKDLERENVRLKRLVADLSLEKQVLKDVASGNL
jgi:hypothetical protein